MKRILLLILLTVTITGYDVQAADNGALPADVPQSHWIYNALQTAADDGWLVSDSGGRFAPDKSASRETVARLLTGAWEVARENGRASGSLSSASEAGKTFTDLAAADAESRSALGRLAAAGVLSGYPDGTIRPEGEITRLEMAVVLAQVASVPETSAVGFTDGAQVPSWGKAAVGKAAAMGLISGYSDGSFRPQQKISHAEALQMISRWAYPQSAPQMVSRSRLPVSEDPVTADILKLVNAERAKKGLSPLRINPTLVQVASYKASAMAEGNYFSHTSPGGEGVEALFVRMGVKNWSRLGENLLKMKGTASAQKAVATWMQSEGHRAIILTPYTDTGIGFARAADGTVYISQAFASF